MISIPIRVLTKNIRYATDSPFQGEERWPIRRPYIANELRFNIAHNREAFICCQEVLDIQLHDILADLNCGGDDWAYVGVGRDDGAQLGEYSPILFRPTVWKPIYWKTLWLSDTPEIPSKDPDAGSIRILTCALFEHAATFKRIQILNTHLDDQSSAARLRAAKIVAQVLHCNTHVPTLLTGDFNSESHQETYQYLSKLQIKDVCEQVPAGGGYGNSNTYTGFGFEHEPAKRIDYIFINYSIETEKEFSWSIHNYGVLPNKFDDGILNSDHRAVVADLFLK